MKAMLACVLLGMLGQVAAQEAQKPAEEKPAAENKTTGDADAAKLVNPVKATEESLARAKKVYGLDCAMCHGKDGAGNGDLADSMKLKLRDYRDAAALKDMTDGEIYTIILKGKGQMMGEEGRLKPGQVWDLVNYVRGFGKK